MRIAAHIPQAAALTIRCGACGAHGAAMVHQPVAEITALLRGNDLPQRHFHLFGFLDVIYQPNAVAQPDAVGGLDTMQSNSPRRGGAFSSALSCMDTT